MAAHEPGACWLAAGTKNGQWNLPDMRVLIIDDEKNIRRALTLAIESMEHWRHAFPRRDRRAPPAESDYGFAV